MCQTPLYTIDALRNAINQAPEHRIQGGALSAARFVSIDTRVLEWLLTDAERLNRLDVRAIDAGFGGIDAMLAAAATEDLDDTSGQDRDSYSDEQDRDSYTVEEPSQ